MHSSFCIKIVHEVDYFGILPNFVHYGEFCCNFLYTLHKVENAPPTIGMGALKNDNKKNAGIIPHFGFFYLITCFLIRHFQKVSIVLQSGRQKSTSTLSCSHKQIHLLRIYLLNPYSITFTLFVV